MLIYIKAWLKVVLQESGLDAPEWFPYDIVTSESIIFLNSYSSDCEYTWPHVRPHIEPGGV